MLRFFRQIRHRLLTNNKFSKYMLYAIGEIVLVVIGILIALQINNWNESKKAEKFEHKLLSELIETLQGDYSKIEEVILWNKRDQASCKIILEHLDNNLPLHDSLLMHFRRANNWSKLMLAKSAFDNAKSYGLHFIKEDETRRLLTTVYEYQIVWSETNDERQTLYYYNTVIPELTQLFEFTSAPSLYHKGVEPNNYEALKTNETYKNILKSNIENRQQENEWLEFLFRDMKKLENKLQAEIALK
ncbi:DUF6090 family protein [Robiginitalea sp. IMCC44478]|uniref:DUF6090 family protein n=1 Tax=Robiginitalea sp. IMCC44478 TaxID=3459122 RepID=UPI0040410212